MVRILLGGFFTKDLLASSDGHAIELHALNYPFSPQMTLRFTSLGRECFEVTWPVEVASSWKKR